MKNTSTRSRSEEEGPDRPDRLHNTAFYVLASVVVLSPVPLGADRPLAWDILGLAVGIPVVLYFGSPRSANISFDRDLNVPLILFALVVGYALIQATDLTPAAWHDPIWERAGAALQRPLHGAIAVDRQAALQYALRLTSYGAVFFLSAMLCKDGRRARIGVAVIAISGCVYAAYGLAIYWSGNTTILWMKKWAYQESLSATFVNRNSAAVFFGLCSLAVLVRVSTLFGSIVRFGGDRRDRIFYYINFLSRHAWLVVGLFLVITACVLTHSRAGLVATLVGWVVFLIVAARSMKASAKRQLAVIAAILAVGIVATLISGQITFDRLSDLGLAEDDQGGRLQVYAIIMHMIVQRPFLGIGLGSFAPVFEMSRPSSVVPYYDLAHNDYLQDSLELGVPVALCLFIAVAWLIAICINGIRIRRRETAFPGLGLAASILVLLHSTLDFSLQIPAITTTYAFLLGIGVAQSRLSRRDHPQRASRRTLLIGPRKDGDDRPSPSVRRVAFLCGGLEPGRDGVGDYLRQLAHAFAERNVECLLVGVNDRLATAVTDTVEFRNGRSIRLLRLPSILPARKRFGLTGRTLDAWQPDWVSLHVIVYAFDDKGILTTELYWLPKILAAYRLHVQMHELWIGEKGSWRSKAGLIGAVQRVALLKLLRRLAPDLLHTTIAYYRDILERHHLHAGIFPLGFGNVLVTDEGDAAWLSSQLRETANYTLNGDRANYWFIGLFGAIYADWSAANDERVLSRIGEVAERINRKVVVLSIGRAGAAAIERFARWRARFPRMDFLMLGPQTEIDISRFFNAIDFGLSSYPGRFLGKSSSAASMLDHSLPLIVFSDDGKLSGPTLPGRPVDAVWDDDAELEDRLIHPPERRKHADGAGSIADRLLKDFEESGP